MPITSKDEKIQENGQEKDAFTVVFTNGAKDQLEDFKKFFKQENYLEVIKLGLSFLQKIKESEEKKITE